MGSAADLGGGQGRDLACAAVSAPICVPSRLPKTGNGQGRDQAPEMSSGICAVVQAIECRWPKAPRAGPVFKAPSCAGVSSPT